MGYFMRARCGAVARLCALAALCLATTAFADVPSPVVNEDGEIVHHDIHMYDSYVYMLDVLEAPQSSYDDLALFSQTLEFDLDQYREDWEGLVDPTQLEAEIRYERSEQYNGWYVSHPVTLASVVKEDKTKYPPKVRGKARELPNNPNDDDRRSVKSEADIAKQLGEIFDVHQQPFEDTPPATHPGRIGTSNPDYIINGEIFDTYAPRTTTSATNIVNKISEKSKEQAPRVIVDLTGLTAAQVEAVLAEVRARLANGRTGNSDLADLKELWIKYPDGTIRRVYPVANKPDGSPGDPEKVADPLPPPASP